MDLIERRKKVSFDMTVLSVSCMFLRPKDSKNITNHTGTECVDSPIGAPGTN